MQISQQSHWVRFAAYPKGPDGFPWRAYINRAPPLVPLRHIQISGRVVANQNLVVGATENGDPNMPSKWIDCYGEITVEDGVLSIVLCELRS